ncbi:MAG: type I-B CRISPR-associated endonuclease Cas1 [Candidatus Kuenenia stuttgartiensis]|jgi:CRISPR-associated protein Cas1|uniref:CRISPR-associated endonuclease Cas1 n=1 Tax=Kuenenia stuttgartiensis TaxID=174633 RepID=Q1Q102_KUEST|nr:MULTISPECIES: type I-B CRISPR-associated endonuclease Cas1b [Kuenenia]MBE7547781.1 type I-B CRISPR-associated endonuclease Cas1 [Planctomycetia bacterium]MBW7941933.1 type I-B CRISPR-associated endonuclease Cas1 [Candidatus Kuenenia stuttgartiensis]MBZ0191268.1 type I-B CRISPR-associated endonuclease Cas1b [Candidatus Kuenenia stuttgartiensis]MCF6152491.1 type I-B CRISPR-associated endonuclease Cas1 [Candidatus Kuenenia stuttgartiensis]MCZ7623586.1 type I-B CRISPR-associated endonuclease Ca
MKETVYIFSNGRLKRKDNTLFFETEDGNKKFIPVENTKEIFMFGETDLNSKVLNFLSQNEIVLSYFNYYGYYAGSFYPREHYNSGFMILRQADHYTDETKRQFIAKKFIEGAVKNCLKILKYYERRGKDLTQYINGIEDILSKLEEQESIEKAMAIEGQIKQLYYNAFNCIIDDPEFSFERRTKRPPRDFLNTLISFSNSVIYSYVLSEIYQTHLDPRIGFLHTTNFRRFTLNLDVAEIFKPVIGDRTIFAVLNKKIITENDFEKQLNGILLKDSARKRFLQYMEERLKETIKHSGLNKQVSYRRLMRLELYKLEKHLMEEETYKPFVMDW